MTTVPPLPEPGFQSPDDRRNIARRFLLEAREELERGSRLQAGEKAWGAVAQNLKVIGELRGWSHQTHQQVENIGRGASLGIPATRRPEAVHHHVQQPTTPANCADQEQRFESRRHLSGGVLPETCV